MKRVRFAPSPTGALHIGGVRTALYNYLYARKHNGKFILRIEDTDSSRFVPGAEEYIIESLLWCGITPDEGVENGKIVEKVSDKHPYAPYRQSQRKGIYRQYAEQLIRDGFAYYAFDTQEELSLLRETAEAKKETFTYNYAIREHLKTSLSMTREETEQRLKSENHWVIRFKMPENRLVKVSDIIRGEIEVNTNTLDDKVLWKAIDGLPTYHLANIVDDRLMEISEVIRGEEWLPSLPLHYLLYEAFGWLENMPEFAHLSLLLKPDGKGKLSKRDGDRLGFPVFPLEWKSPNGEISSGYRESGYYPEAFINMLALLGWNPGTEQELFSMEELSEQFSLDRVIKSGAKFNPEKAKWFNQAYLRKKSVAELSAEFRPVLIEKGIAIDEKKLNKIIELIKERAFFTNEFWALSDYLFVSPTQYDESMVTKYWRPEMGEIMNNLYNQIEQIPEEQFSIERLPSSISDIIKRNGWTMGQIMNNLRLSLVGSAKGIGVAEIMAIIGKPETLLRISRFLNR